MELLNDIRLSEANSASLKRPGRIHVNDLNVDSKVDIVETLFKTKDSYRAAAEVMAGRMQGMGTRHRDTYTPSRDFVGHWLRATVT